MSVQVPAAPGAADGRGSYSQQNCELATMCVIEARKGSENASAGRPTRAAATKPTKGIRWRHEAKFIFTFESINFYHLASG